MKRRDSHIFPFRLYVRGITIDVEALVDTGFDGDLAVPEALLQDVGEPDDFERWTLADGAAVFAPEFEATAELDGFESISVLLSAIGDEPLVGRGVTDQFGLLLDHGRRLVIEA